MNNINKHSPRGQALILIVFGIIGLIGMTALAIDGGNAYSDRRHAQNAADTAALGGALAYIRGQTTTWQNASVTLAADNGYNNDGVVNTVNAYLCTDPNSSCGTYAGNNQYLQVIIVSHVNTYFAQVIGIPQMTNTVQAIAHITPGTNQPLYGGHAIATTDTSSCKDIQYGGNAKVVISGSGIYDNSGSSCAFFNNSTSSNQLSAPSMCVVGGAQYNNGALSVPDSTNSGITQYCPAQPGPILPDITCSGNAAVNGSTMSPGWYDGGGNGQFPPSGVTTLQDGVYCVKNDKGFELSGNQSLTGNNIVIYMQDGDVDLTGNGNVTLTAPESNNCSNTGLDGLLIYLPPTNSSPVTINGGGNFSIVGSILAPASQCNMLGGGSNTTPLQSQLICNSVKLGGQSDTYIHYDPCQQVQLPTNPMLNLAK
jgi:Flp pilus assembly protein TadG